MSKEDVFLHQIKTKIEKFDEDSTKHKNNFRRYRRIVFILSGVTSVFSGVALSYPEFQSPLNIGILILGAVTAFVTSLEGMMRPHDLWMMERNVYYSLLDLKEDYEFQSADGATVNVDEYHEKMQAILNSSKEKWTKKFKLESTNSGKKPSH